MTTEAQPNNTELDQRYCKQAEITHYFAENLAQTLGVFHGINDTAKKLCVEGVPMGALNIVLFDLQQIMMIRCKIGSRLTDTSLTKFAWPCLEYILIDTQLISNHDHEPAFAARFIGLARGRSLPRWSQAPTLISCSLVGQKAATDSKANELRLLEHDFFASL